MSKKIFFFDIDGTLADQEDILPSNQKALRELRLKGHTVMIASGRPAGYIRRMFSGLSDGFIAANGRRIEHEGNVLLDNSFTVAELKEIIKLCRVSQCSYCLLGDGVVYHGNPLYLYGHTRPYESIDVIHEDSWDIRDVRAYAFDIIYKDAAHLKTIKQNFDGKYIINDHFDGSADVSSVSFNKGHAVAYTTSAVGFSQDDSYAFGDGDNDVHMFEAAGTAVAMENATRAAKKAADYVTRHYKEDGIFHALKHLKVISCLL